MRKSKDLNRQWNKLNGGRYLTSFKTYPMHKSYSKFLHRGWIDNVIHGSGAADFEEKYQDHHELSIPFPFKNKS